MMHYYSHNINDFNNATIHLSVEEECMYHRALAWYYSNELPLPKDKAKIYRYLRATTKKLQTAVNNILDDFFTEESDGFHQSRCDSEIAEYQSKQQKAVEAGKASAEARRKSNAKQSDVEQATSDSSTTVEQEINDPSTTVQPTNNQEPITNNHKTNKNQYAEQVAEVFEFWKSTFGKNEQTKLSDTRRNKIIDRLKDGYTVEQIKLGITHCSQRKHNVEGGYTDLELICRSVEKLDFFIGFNPQSQAQPQPQNQSRFGTAADPMAVDVVWNQPLRSEPAMTFDEMMAEMNANTASPVDFLGN